MYFVSFSDEIIFVERIRFDIAAYNYPPQYIYIYIYQFASAIHTIVSGDNRVRAVYNNKKRYKFVCVCAICELDVCCTTILYANITLTSQSTHL